MLHGETVNGSAGIVSVRLQIGEVVVEEVLLNPGVPIIIKLVI
jgi:hypothetical protein